MKYFVYFGVLCLILLRYKASLPTFKNGDLVKITTKVYGDPVIYDRAQYLKIQGLKVYLPKYPEVNYGDTIEVIGTVSNDKLQRQSRLLITSYKQITNSKPQVLKLREKIISFYKASLPEPFSSLVAGIVIGSKRMPESFWEKLKGTGTAHVVVASGTNITLTISFMLGFLTLFLNRKRAIYITFFAILIYMIISGMEAPIVRASIMGSILLFSQEHGRVVNSWRILLYSGIIMLLIKPVWITDVGFLLSFTATGSLMLFQNKIDTLFTKFPIFLREGLSTSVSAQIGVAPILYFTFGQFNLLSPIINALVLWTIPYIMIGGAVAGLIGIFVPLVGRLILFVIYPMLWYFEKIISIF
jgi:competence protein ComEC